LPAARPEPSSSENAVESIFGIDQKPLFDVESLFPAPRIADGACQDLEQRLGEPVLARVENREHDVGERAAAVLSERAAAAAQRTIRHRVGRARGAALHRDPFSL